MTSYNFVYRWSVVLWAVVGVTGIAGVVYLATLQRQVVGICEYDYCADIGEFQVALPLWGTVHHTGYPLYMLLGSPFVSALGFLGIAPATGGSLYSFVWQMAALAFLVHLTYRLTLSGVAALGISLVFAFIEPIWMHAVIAEVYSLSMFFSVLILYIARDLHENWSDSKGWFLAFICGLAVFHHRLLLFLVLMIVLYLLPRVWRRTDFVRWSGIAVLCGAAGFLPYLDIPLRMWLGSIWTYSQENTWASFWHVFSAAEESQRQLRMVGSIEQLWAAVAAVGQTIYNDLRWPGVLLGAGTLGVMFVARRTEVAYGRVLLVAVLIYVCFPILMPRLHLTQPSLMFAYLAGLLLVAWAIGGLGLRWRNGVGALCLAWAGWLGMEHAPFVTTVTNDRSGVEYAAAVDKVAAPPGSVIMAPWGSAFFILAYTHLIEGRLPDMQVVDHRADFRTLTDNGERPVYTHVSTLYLFGHEWWAQRVDVPLQVASAGPNMVKLAAAPRAPAPAPAHALDDGIGLFDWSVQTLETGQFHVTLHWTAVESPTGDYSTFVHVSDAEAIAGPEDILAQSDYHKPVYGYYPTPHWQPGEAVREDHVVEIPDGRVPQTIVVGMYYQDDAGAFQQLGTVSLRNVADDWQVRAHNSP